MTRRTLLPIIGLLAALALAGCRVPADPEGTTGSVRGDTLRVGLLTVEISSPDRAAVAALAERLDARPELVKGPAHTLLAALEEGELHLLAGDIPASTPMSAHAGLSDPIGKVALATGTEDRVLLIRSGENGFLMELNRALATLTGEDEA